MIQDIYYDEKNKKIMLDDGFVKEAITGKQAVNLRRKINQALHDSNVANYEEKRKNGYSNEY